MLKSFNNTPSHNTQGLQAELSQKQTPICPILFGTQHKRLMHKENTNPSFTVYNCMFSVKVTPPEPKQLQIAQDDILNPFMHNLINIF